MRALEVFLMLVEALLGRFFWVLHFVPKKASVISEWLCHAVHTHQPLSSLSRDWWWVYKQPDGLGPLAPQSSQHRCEGDQRQQNHVQRPAGVFQGQNKASWWYAQQPDSVLSLFKVPYFHIWLIKCNKLTFVLFFCIFRLTSKFTKARSCHIQSQCYRYIFNDYFANIQ